jgi:hypothetical protein
MANSPGQKLKPILLTKPEIMENNKDSIIEISSGTLWECEMIKSLLEDSEIESFLKNSVLNTYAYDALYSQEVKVLISSSDFEKAKVIVDDYYKNLKSDHQE